MGEESVVVPSAVVLPEVPIEREGSPNHGTKRRASSASSSSSKRPKIQSTEEDVNTTAKLAPSRRGAVDVDERKRGKRLFGGLLGTLSQNSASSAQKRRTDIDRKQREKLKAQAEEDGELKKQRLEKLIASRTAEQKIWDRQAQRTRHENDRNLARFLRTKTQPILYYKPWELQAEEEELIKQQIEDVERQIEADLAKDQQPQADAASQDVDMQEDLETALDNNGEPLGGSNEIVRENGEPPASNDDGDGMKDGNDPDKASTGQNVSVARTQASPDALKDHVDETGEDVVQGDEDAVLY